MSANRPVVDSPDQGQPAVAAAYVLASVLGVFVGAAVLLIGYDVKLALLAYFIPCEIVMCVHIGLSVMRMLGHRDQAMPGRR
jgi:hypothetical protein